VVRRRRSRIPAPRDYAEAVQTTIWQGRVTRAAAKYGEHAPMATTCCNACRACVQTNVIGLGLAAVAAAGYGVARALRRLT
jgi:hypothetical protein